jgi:hypothetical protein
MTPDITPIRSRKGMELNKIDLKGLSDRFTREIPETKPLAFLSARWAVGAVTRSLRRW